MPGSNSLNVTPPSKRRIPDIDVLIPHYNAAEALSLTLGSIDAQDWDGTFRIVVVDDGSDATVLSQVRERLEQRDRPVVLLENGTNRGRPYSRNVLLDAMESPFAAWVDAGDEWYPAKTAAQMEKAEALGGPEADEPFWITCNFDWQWSGRETEHRIQAVDGDQIKALLRGKTLRAYLWTLLAPSRMFRDVGWFDEALPRLQDLDFFLRFQLKSGRLHTPPSGDSLCVYHKSDLGRDADQVRACYQRIFEKHRYLYCRYGQKFVDIQLYNMELHAARFAAHNEQYARRRKYLLRAFGHRPKQFVRRLVKGDLPR